jgi:hypothetical protein
MPTFERGALQSTVFSFAIEMLVIIKFFRMFGEFTSFCSSASDNTLCKYKVIILRSAEWTSGFWNASLEHAIFVSPPEEYLIKNKVGRRYILAIMA